MTIKEAIIKVLEDNIGAFTYIEVHDLVNAKNYVDWSNAKTPTDTIGAQLGHFIRKNDTRVKRFKSKNGFLYYSSKNENQINLDVPIEKIKESVIRKDKKSFHERHLHKLLVSYLKSRGIYAKTIFHEKSLNTKDDHQKWVHPDMVAIDFVNLKNKNSNALMKLVNKADAFNITSYEIKKEINTDYELKKYFFQAVSNSSWANYGYLVAFEISKNLLGEMERLSQSFGIGIIELKSNPYESEIHFVSKYRDLEYKTIDKLCELNPDFEKFISQTEALLSASDKFLGGTLEIFNKYCDEYFKTDSEIEEYCKTNGIPYED
ncbi:HTH domain-containing protein [Chryseobacterium vaccae]|uniref:HTH domain-containing protein n=1 Tax=Chryseobacterium vaccae TaxID=2604424 RepID=UPI001295EFAA|nr:HTH domain-containing protein [Chryseobacterium vaccae]